MTGALLHCPIRGQLTVPEKASDGITFTEEKRRIDCIKFLLQKGYPAAHFHIETTLLRFGHQGRNSFRTDLAVLDVPTSTLPDDLDVVKSHIKLIAEIKRGNADAKRAKHTQVMPALAFLDDLTALGIYWDDIEQRFFYRTIDDNKKATTHETAAAALPRWGQAVGTVRLELKDLRTTNLKDLFQRIEDVLHVAVQDKSRRYQVMLQLLLVKLYDEHIHPGDGNVMTLQDFSDAPIGDDDIEKVLNTLLTRALGYYGKFLPESSQIADAFPVTGSTLRAISALLAPIRVLNSKREVIQSFYMYFAKAVYKWDLAQYFTPVEVIDFIVALTNPTSWRHG